MKKTHNFSFCLIGLFLMSFTNINAQKIKLNVSNLSKNWQLTKYSVGWFSEEPSDKEKNDYLKLKSDMTFTSVSEGIFEKGTWQLQKEHKRITLSKKGDKAVLVFSIKKIKTNELVVIIDNDSEPDAKYLNIHFEN
ncbi:lipocalin family protein [Aquimarina spongiae]|uniref:Lipocalin-like domain-containing protein n=1 Tax=Aquimarina spongiae TaxID=570521 RepID=A0A1M6GJX8_9FLAO|nr:lipocalin family protein [Aquimarina spongiae]SHJ10223.1 Lipocalin-like domain-containing protein [Aquimarina spongiae]